MTFEDKIYSQTKFSKKTVDARTILTNIISLVSNKMHKTRRQALIACESSIMNGSAAGVTSIGHGIQDKTFEKYRIKYADRQLTNLSL
jgi:hypothetical protein